MAQAARFFDSELVDGDQDRVYSATDWAAIFDALVESNGYAPGVGSNLAVVQNTPPAMNVVVGSGGYFIEGREYENSADLVLAIGANASGNPRIDRVVVRLDNDSRTIVAAVLAGTPAGAPVAPALTQNSTIWEEELAQVAVANGAVSIVTANITDTRTATGPRNAIPKSLLSANGDLLTRIAGVVARLAIGTTSQLLGVTGSGLPGWKTVDFWIGHTWTIALPGTVSGATNFVNPKRARVPTGMAAHWVRADSGIRAGTSVTWDLRHATTIAGVTAGTSVTGFTSQSAVPGGATVAPTVVALTDAEYYAPVPSAVAGSPDNWTVDLLVRYRFDG